MRKLVSIILCFILAFAFSGCTVDDKNSSNIENTDSKSEIFLVDQENVKISFSGVSSDIGIGEGICLLVENSRSESIIISVSEVSLNDVMQTVIQPQMPLNLTSPGKESTQTFVFPNTKIEGNKAQFKIHVLNENYEEIFATQFIEVSL